MARKRKVKKYLKSFEQQWEWKRTSHHHMIPSSRGGSDCGENVVKINQFLHNRFHDIFINRKPEECVVFLIEYFLKGDYSILERVLRRHYDLVCNPDRL